MVVGATGACATSVVGPGVPARCAREEPRASCPDSGNCTCHVPLLGIRTDTHGASQLCELT